MAIKQLKCDECGCKQLEVLYNDITDSFQTKCIICGYYQDYVGYGN